eukprot:155189_1
MQVLIIVIAFIYSHYISQFKSSIKSRYNQQSNCICTINVFIRSYHIYTDTDTNIDSSIDFQGAKNITYVCNQHIHIQKLNTISAYTHTIVCISRTLNSITSSLAPNLSSCISLSIPPTPPSNTPSNLLPAQSNLLSAQSKLYSSNLSTQSNLLSASILICLCSLLCILCKQLLPLCHIMKILLFTLLLTMPIVNGTITPTQIPTVNPTAIPTVNPTAIPTVNPTAIPTVNPTAIPTVNPTIPTVNPT